MFRQEYFAEVRQDPPVKGQTAPNAGCSTHPPGGREEMHFPTGTCHRLRGHLAISGKGFLVITMTGRLYWLNISWTLRTDPYNDEFPSPKCE